MWPGSNGFSRRGGIRLSACRVAALALFLVTTLAATAARGAGIVSGSILMSTESANPGHGLYRVDLGSGHLTRLTTGARDWDAAWSRNGKLIAFDRGHSSPEGTPESSLYVIDSSGKGLHSVGDVQALSASWGPGDKELVISDPGSNGGISVVSPDGAGLRKLLSSGYDPVWSPDGRRILYLDGGTIYAMNADGTDPHAIVTPPPAAGGHLYRFAAPAWAPNGDSISFVEMDLDNQPSGTLETARPDGSDRHAVAQMATWQDFYPQSSFPFWAPDSRSIAFLELHGAQVWLVAVPSTGGKAAPLYKRSISSSLTPTSPASWTAAA